MKSNSTPVTKGFDQNGDFAFQIPSLTEENEALIQNHIAHRRYGFTLGDFHFLVPHGLYCELLVDVDITPLPASPHHFVGLSNHRGNIISIYTLAPLLEIPSIKPKYAYLLGHAESGAAILISEKPTLIDLREAENREATNELPEYLKDCVAESCMIKRTTWHALKHDALFRKLATAD